MVEANLTFEQKLRSFRRRILGKNPKDIIFNSFLYLFFIVFVVLMLSPFIYVVVTSLKSQTTLNGRALVKYDFSAYIYVLSSKNIVRSFINTVGVTIVEVILSVSLTAIAAFPLAMKLKGKNVILMFILITMLFSGGLIPYYLLIRNVLKIQDTYLVYILVGLLGAFNVFIVKGYYQGIPYEIYESAIIDGASDFKIFLKIYAPLAKPIYATIALWVAVGKWNDYMTGLLYVTENHDLDLIQMTLRNMIVESTSTSGIGGDSQAIALAESIKMATVVISLIPIMLVYPFVQKYFTKGVMLGSVKG